MEDGEYFKYKKNKRSSEILGMMEEIYNRK